MVKQTAVLVISAVAGCAGPPKQASTPPVATHVAQAADAWLAAHPKEWVVNVDDHEHGFAPPPFVTGCEPQNKLYVLRFEADGTGVDVMFHCPLGPNPRREDLAAAFAFAVLQQLPHGISVPGWKFAVLTPVSSIRTGVTFETPADGRLGLDIDTPLFALSGSSEDRSCEAPADGPSKPGCYTVREHRIRLRLHLTAPYDPSVVSASQFSAAR